uniref:Zinc finger domain protein n=1 Tax=Podoviridae sp. ctz6O13 TaxID=2827757 RepID=A0A8S5TKT1_9CAUD|nr:MAG TPA: zinc finger domain protein [Podoviridae sp. ctz6O13]
MGKIMPPLSVMVMRKPRICWECLKPISSS